jgi:cysteinyl-tRNA synthetase
MAGGNLYYDISTFPDYGKLALLNLDDLKAGARIDIDENKRNPYDFVLWFTKSKFENQALTWDSPWGRGYPGWHIECSAMSMKYLGKQFDIHTGGIDHIQIHHTNEIAQSEGATGQKWVNYWLHNEFLVMDKGKMSKSSGNFLTLQYVIDQGYDALDYRFFLLGGHYRSQLTFSWESMESAKNARKSLLKQVAKLVENAGTAGSGRLAGSAAGMHSFAATIAAIPADSPARAYLDRFKAAIEADLNTPRAFSELQGIVRDAAVPAKEALACLESMDAVLGLNLVKSALAQIEAQKSGSAGAEKDPRIDALVAERIDAKKAKNFARADEIRNQLKVEGILLEDSPAGTTWKRI